MVCRQVFGFLVDHCSCDASYTGYHLTVSACYKVGKVAMRFFEQLIPQRYTSAKIIIKTQEWVKYLNKRLLPQKYPPQCCVDSLPLCKTYMENSPLRKCTENFLTEFFCKTMLSADISWPLLIVGLYHFHGWDGNHCWSADIDNNYTCQFEVYWNIFGTNCTWGPLASRYLTWWGDFNFIRYMSIHNRAGQYLTMSMWSI